jgi:cell filamentation protein
VTIAKFAQVTRTQPCVQNLHEWYVQNLHIPLRKSDYAKTRNYWKYLKAKLKKEGGQLISATTQLKLRAPDGKLRMTSKINDREIFMKGIDYSYYYEKGE